MDTWERVYGQPGLRENMSAGAPALDGLHQGDPGAQRFVVTYPVGRMYDRFL